jgi:hypothetical protein
VTETLVNKLTVLLNKTNLKNSFKFDQVTQQTKHPTDSQAAKQAKKTSSPPHQTENPWMSSHGKPEARISGASLMDPREEEKDPRQEEAKVSIKQSGQTI